jgi:uncharacterized protein (TIRG00374 family)
LIVENVLSRTDEYRYDFGKLLRSPSKLVLVGLNVVVYYLLIQWLARNIHPDKLMEHLGQIPAWALLGSLSINLMALVLYGTRMALLLGKDFRTAFSIVNIGYALNTLIPLRLGEAMKIYLGHRFYRVPLIGIFAASVAEKLADLLKLLLLGVVVVVFTAGELIQSSVLLPVAVLVCVCVATVILFRLYIVRIVKLLPKRGRLRRISIELHKHAGSYPIRRVLTISFGIWMLNVALVFFTFNTYLSGFHINFLDAATLLLILSFAIAIPSAPAGIGLFEAGIVAYLTQKLGVGNEAALAAAAAFHLVIALPQLFITSWLLWCGMKFTREGT